MGKTRQAEDRRTENWRLRNAFALGMGTILGDRGFFQAGLAVGED
jgi:hypothetical protein